MKTPINEKFALVTGGSKGIGKHISIQLAQKGFNLLLVARGKQNLQKVSDKIQDKYGVKVKYYSIDLTDENVGQNLYDWCLEKDISISVLINNAGFGVFGEFEKLSLEKQLDMIDLNVKGVVELTHTFLPMLKQQNKGYILNVSSFVGLFPLAYGSIYSATKSFVNSFSESLAYELKDSCVSVSYVCPGITDTNFYDNSFLSFSKKDSMTPEQLAKISVDKLLANKRKILPKLIKYISKIPNFLLKRIVSQKVKKNLKNF